jgi:hypothetical protein
MIQPDGRRTDIGRQYGIQNDLRRQHCDNKGYLKLMLDIPVPSDYMSIISYYAGDV